MKGVRSAHHYISLRTVHLKKQISQSGTLFQMILMAARFFLNDAWNDSLSLNLYTDASGSLDYGGIFGSEWFFGAWPDHWKQLSITI